MNLCVTILTSAHNCYFLYLSAIGSTAYSGGGTLTGKALWHAATQSLSTSSGRRPGVPAVIVVVTDGK